MPAASVYAVTLPVASYVNARLSPPVTACSSRLPAPHAQATNTVLGDYGLDLRGIVRVQIVTQDTQFELLDLDLGQAGGVGVCSVERRCRRFGPVGEKCTQNVLGDFQAQASGELRGMATPYRSSLSRAAEERERPLRD
jgi:hypothetical protein